MASRIYPDCAETSIRYFWQLKNIDFDFLRYWKDDEYIYPIIAKGNIFEGIEAKW